MTLRCEKVVFRGRVQGVGFRATTCAVASRFDVTGWVRNESDGTVMLMVEGQPAEIDRFLDATRDAMAGYVEGMDREIVPGKGGFEVFTIRS